MKKKLVLFVLTAVMTLGMTFTVLADLHPNAECSVNPAKQHCRVTRVDATNAYYYRYPTSGQEYDSGSSEIGDFASTPVVGKWYIKNGSTWEECSGTTHGPAPAPEPEPTPSSCETEKKPSKKANIELTPYMIAFLNDIVNKNKAQAVAVEAPQTVVVDKDTCKSEAPDHTVGVSNTNSKVGDLKVHTVNETTQANQKFLADSFAAQQGKRARILVNASVHPRRELGVDAGKKEALSWVNLEKVAQPVYAVCYNQTDKAYYISGVLDSNGVANLNDFILRDATNVTIFVLE